MAMETNGQMDGGTERVVRDKTRRGEARKAAPSPRSLATTGSVSTPLMEVGTVFRGEGLKGELNWLQRRRTGHLCMAPMHACMELHVRGEGMK